MPEFILDHGTQETAKAFRALDSFTQGYIEAMFFTDEEQLCEESGREMPAVIVNMATMETRFVGGDSPGFGDLAPETLSRIIADCERFQTANAALLEQACSIKGDHTYDETRAGHDFWYTRNGHGCGFWDRGLGEAGDKLTAACGHGTDFRGLYSYVGDDGLIYLS